MTQVTAVMVTYQSGPAAARALDALRPAFDRGELRAVVVDNHSGDGTADLIAQAHPWAELVRSSRNLGYGRGCNLGFERVSTPYALIMNPDVLIAPTDVARLAELLDGRPRAAVAAPATRFAGREYQHAGGLPTPLSVAMGVAPPRRPILPGVESFLTDWVCGAIMLVRAEAFQALRGFDPRFFLYFEETDLCRRLVDQGWEVWATGGALAEHAGGASARTVDPSLRQGSCLHAHYYPSRYYYLSKHHGRFMAWMAESVDLVARAARDVGRVILRRPSRGELRTRLRAPLFRLPENPA
ncbi:MAG TPA: glycosyltransferase family 2 protein [Planctomycetota bacterium]